MKKAEKIPTRQGRLIQGLNDLIDYINKSDNVSDMTILEIGSWAGTSADIFAKRFKKVICVDPWEPTEGTISVNYNMQDVENEFDKIAKKHDNIIKIKGRSENVIDKVFGVDQLFKIDVVYIDGEHTEKAVSRDIKNYKHFATRYLCGHDYWPDRFPGVIKAVNESMGKPDKVFSDTSWLFKIK